MSKLTNNINRIILGTVQFGLDYGINNTQGKLSKHQVFDILERAVSTGINTLDTADGYGEASKLIGEFTTTTGHAFLINTKFKVNATSTIIGQLQHSLTLLQAKRANVYFFHDFNDFVKYPEIEEDLHALKENQLISNTGLSIYTNDQFEKAINAKWIDVIQVPFNLLDNNYQRGHMIKKAKDYGKTIQVRSVFLQGLFFKKNESFPTKLETLKPYVNLLQHIFSDSGKDVEDIALSYVFAQPSIDNVLIGVDSLVHLERNIKYIASELDPALIDRINDIRVKETELLYPYNWT